ncbi:MAG: hypothetical protein R3B95_07930 [Nitrospirales bacterium]|nr:hypothetical protein [Nitrospirales bacterium]
MKKRNILDVDKVVGKVLDTLTYEQIHILRASLKEYNVGSIVEALLLKRLKALGYVEEGQKVLAVIGRSVYATGWSKSWDGGSRLSAMQTFIEFNPDQGRAQAFDLLVNDHLSEWRILIQ